ncbi:MAG: 4-(cytidine 5'-diphospho)-2-C-methyl-D-erythritol kinase [Deltaproteobacteria bacterium]|nr:4-(cytidine 5'-diphospho)-2-C-methyl-D-erythritol kinase [Deltaproteobacteria bacterium]
MSISHNILSPAKVNLFLRVLRKRDDGYHDIVSLMQHISLYDEIVLDVGEGNGIFMECDEKNIPLDNTNLAFRAAEAFLDRTGLKRRVCIKMKKRIPVGAGLGGGSSNAASVLMGLNEITASGLSGDELMKIGAGLGSDVPFFILRGSAIASGRGERLEGIKIHRFWYVLINPGFQVSTAWAYKNLNLTKNIEDINITISKVLPLFSADGLRDSHALKGFLINDLEDVTIKRYPEINGLKNALTDRGAFAALMSGSGPTVFGIFDEERARKAFEQIKKQPQFKKMSVFVAQGIG